MRRRAPKPPAPGEELIPPEGMLRCHVADWVRASEAEQHDFTARCQTCSDQHGRGDADCLSRLWFVALRRWQAVREAWLADQGLAGSPMQWRVWRMSSPAWPRRTDFIGEDGKFCDAVDALDQNSRFLKLLVRR